MCFEQCESGGWRAYAPGLPVCESYGETVEDAKEQLADIIETYFMKPAPIPAPIMRQSAPNAPDEPQ